MRIDEARGRGAMALFGEKYGNEVRVVDIGDGWSLELCAGTHVKRSGELGLVTLLSESAIGSGVRRVDALVGAGAYGYQAKERALVGQLSGLLGARPDELSERVSSLLTKLKDSEKELAALRQATLLAQAGALAAGAQTVGETRVVTHDAGEVGGDELRTLVLDVRSRLGEASPAVVAIGGVSKGRPVVVVATNAAAREQGVRAGALVRTASGILGGGGGGKDDLAQGGGTDPARLAEALAAVADGGERLTCPPHPIPTGDRRPRRPARRGRRLGARRAREQRPRRADRHAGGHARARDQREGSAPVRHRAGGAGGAGAGCGCCVRRTSDALVGRRRFRIATPRARTLSNWRRPSHPSRCGWSTSG